MPTDDTTRQRRPRTTPIERENALTTLPAQYRNGATVRDLAEQTGRSYGWVHRILADAGVEFRARGGGINNNDAQARR